jgi:hypothetical protein
MWPSLVKIQYIELKLSCENDPVVKHSIYSNGDLDLWPSDAKINKFLPLLQGNHVGKIGKDPIYRTKVIVRKRSCLNKKNWQQGRFRTITLVLYIGYLPILATWFPCGRGRNLFILGSLGQRSRSPLLWIELLITGSFPHDNFSSVYWIFTKLDHMIALWKGKNPIYFGVIRSKVKVTVTINKNVDNRIVSAR